MDPYLARILEIDLDTLALGMRLVKGQNAEARRIGTTLVEVSRRIIRRKQREWRRFDEMMWAELGYMDLGGEG